MNGIKYRPAITPIEFCNSRYTVTDENRNILNRMKIMVSLIDKNQHILDVGCGSGMLMGILLKSGHNVQGIDISQNAVDQAKKNGFNVLQHDISVNLPYKDGTFDCVVLGEVIEHVFDTDHILLEIHRILKKNGSLILSTPNVASLGRRVFLFFGKNPILEYNLRVASGHIRYFTKADLYEILNVNHFKVEKFVTDTVNLTKSGRISFSFLAKIFPTLSQTLIIKAVKN